MNRAFWIRIIFALYIGIEFTVTLSRGTRFRIDNGKSVMIKTVQRNRAKSNILFYKAGRSQIFCLKFLKMAKRKLSFRKIFDHSVMKHTSNAIY